MNKEWLQANIPWLLTAIFLGGGIYTQVMQNSNTLSERKEDLGRIDVLEVTVNQNRALLKELATDTSVDQEKFLAKLDEVINRLDQRDASQNELITGLAIEVSVLKDRLEREHYGNFTD